MTPASVRRPVEFVIGFDETGRGNVIGPMIMGTAIDVFLPPPPLRPPCSNPDSLSLGMSVHLVGTPTSEVYRDSKSYTSLVRLSKLATSVIPRDRAILVSTTTQREAHEIDEASLVAEISLNTQELDMIVAMLNTFASDARQMVESRSLVSKGTVWQNGELPKCTVVIDQIGASLASSVKKTIDYIKQRVQDSAFLKLSTARYVMIPRAESKFQAVAVASIVARHELEVQMRRLDKVYGAQLGSGSPSDPKVKRWLQEVFDEETMSFPRCVRHSWSTCAAICKKRLEGRKVSIVDDASASEGATQKVSPNPSTRAPGNTRAKGNTRAHAHSTPPDSPVSFPLL